MNLQKKVWNTNTSQPGLIEVLVVFLVSLLYMLKAGPFLVSLTGKWAPLLFTLGFGVLPILYTVLVGYNVNKVFTVKVPSIIDLLGGLLVSAGMFLLVLYGTSLAASFFPGMQKTESVLRDHIKNDNIFIAILAISILPAVCEELLYRGFILSGLKNIDNKWIAIVFCGFLFGVMHFDIYRIPFTIAIGIGLSYAAWETSSIFVPIVMHAVHNLVLLLLTRNDILNEKLSVSSNDPYFILKLAAALGISFLLVFVGSRLLKKKASAKIFPLPSNI